MGYLYKQLTKEIVRNKLFLFLLFLLTAFTSSMFFFVRFSIDGNQKYLDGQNALSENQIEYQEALHANHILSYNLTLCFTLLTAFVFFVFYYRYFKANRKQIGLLKANGFSDKSLAVYFVLFTAVFALIGALVGMVAGYFLSDVLLRSGAANYNVTGLTKDITAFHLFFGLGVPTCCFCFISYVCSYFFRRKEAGILIAGESKNSYGVSLRIANKISNLLPVSDKFSIRMALRKPVSLLLILIAVMSFLTCMIIGLSIHGSGAKVMLSQTTGHHYNFEMKYNEPKYAINAENRLYFLEFDGLVHSVEQKIVGMDGSLNLLQLQNMDGQMLPALSSNEIYVSQGFGQLYQVKKNDTVTLALNGSKYQMVVADVAFNAASNSVYVSKSDITRWMNLPEDAYNGIYSEEVINDGDSIITKEEKLDRLNREAVSNQTSGVINQVIGILIGCILLFLALFMNFQDSTRDMLILNLLGYPVKEIRNMLINIFRPVVWIFFLMTLWPSIIVAKSIQYSLSRQMNDYIPFGTSVLIILLAFVIVNMIYFLVQLVFQIGIKKIIRKEEYSDFINRL